MHRSLYSGLTELRGSPLTGKMALQFTTQLSLSFHQFTQQQKFISCMHEIATNYTAITSKTSSNNWLRSKRLSNYLFKSRLLLTNRTPTLRNQTHLYIIFTTTFQVNLGEPAAPFILLQHLFQTSAFSWDNPKLLRFSWHHHIIPFLITFINIAEKMSMLVTTDLCNPTKNY